AGADVQYIITGQREQDINPHQRAVLQLYDALSETQQREILCLIDEKKQLNELKILMEEMKGNKKIA
ncbi:MAG: hypothetical protein R8L53_01140, partial [Mariprofundales bacterium]